MRKNTLSRMLTLLICLCLVLSVMPLTGMADAPDTLVSLGIFKINKHGNIQLKLSHEDVKKVFQFGDVVTVTFGNQSVDLPIVTEFACVETGKPGLFLRVDGQEAVVQLAINMGSFPDTYGIAHQPDPKNDPNNWVFEDGYSMDTEFTFTMKEKAGYLDQFLVRNISYTDNREDYPQLSDAEFANFRMVHMGNIREGVLYRSSSPIDSRRNRSSYSDAAAREAGITVFIDLADGETDIPKKDGFPGSYFATQQHIAVAASADVTNPENIAKFADCFRFMAENPGVYDIFCREGKDRTGICLAILECLMGASYQEVADDYMQSFCNYYNLTPDSETYQLILSGNLIKILNGMFDADIQTADLEAEAEEFLLAAGMEQAVIVRLKANLSGAEATPETESAEPAAQTTPPTAEAAQPETTAAPAPVSAEPAPVQRTYTVYYILGIVLLAAAVFLFLRRRKQS